MEIHNSSAEEIISLLDQYLAVIDRLSNERSQVAKLEHIKDLPQVSNAALQGLEAAESRVASLRSELSEIEQQIRLHVPDFESGNEDGIVGPTNYQNDGEEDF